MPQQEDVVFTSWVVHRGTRRERRGSGRWGRRERGAQGPPPHYSSCPRTTITSMFPNHKPLPWYIVHIYPRNVPHNTPGLPYTHHTPLPNKYRSYTHYNMCVFLTLNRFFYSSTSSTTSFRADSSSLIEALWSQHCNMGSYVVPGRQQAVVYCHVNMLGYIRHNINTPATPIHLKREK